MIPSQNATLWSRALMGCSETCRACQQELLDFGGSDVVHEFPFVVVPLLKGVGELGATFASTAITVVGWQIKKVEVLSIRCLVQLVLPESLWFADVLLRGGVATRLVLVDVVGVGLADQAEMHSNSKG